MTRPVAAVLVLLGAAGIYLAVVSSIVPAGPWQTVVSVLSGLALALGIIRPHGPWRTR